jgi:hypothetical protein
MLYKPIMPFWINVSFTPPQNAKTRILASRSDTPQPWGNQIDWKLVDSNREGNLINDSPTMEKSQGMIAFSSPLPS